MQQLLSDSAFYWLLWLIFSLVGFLIGWSLRAFWRERALIEAYERSEQERNSLAQIYAQLKQQHDGKASELKRLITELSQLRQQSANFDLEKTLLVNKLESGQLQLEKAVSDSQHLAEKAALLDDQAQHLRTRNAQLTAEFTYLQEELQGWKTLQRDFSVMLRQVQTMENTIRALEQERNDLRRRMDIHRADGAADLHFQSSPSHLPEMDAAEDDDHRPSSVLRKIHSIRK